MSKTPPTDCSEISLPDLDTIAKQTKLVIRKSCKFSPDVSLQSLLSSVASGQGSGNQIASELKERIKIEMARQSMHDRFTAKSTAFLIGVICHSLELATTQDQTIGKEAVSEVKIGDLVLRDMGYFSLQEFTVIEDLGAWRLTRLPLTTEVILENGKTLESRLRGRNHDVLDLAVIVGSQGKKVSSDRRAGIRCGRSQAPCATP